MQSQARIKELAEQLGPDKLVVVMGSMEVGGVELWAKTVTTGDPTWAGDLAGVELRLPVYHILEPEVKAAVEPKIYEEQVGLMELAMDSKEVADAARRHRQG